MARKRKRKTRNKGVLAPITEFFSWSWEIFLRALPILLILGATGGAFFGVRKTLHADAALNVTAIEVFPASGLSHGRRQSLEQALLGKNILEIDLGKAARGLEENPQLESARLVRKMPATIEVHLTQRTPVAYVRFSSRSSYRVVSRDGTVLDVESSRSASLPLIEAFHASNSNPRIGNRVKAKGFQEVVAFLEAFSKHDLAKRETLARISLDKQGQVILSLSAGPEIRMGRDPSRRLETWEKVSHLLEGNGRSQIEYMDLQYDNVVVKRKK